MEHVIIHVRGSEVKGVSDILGITEMRADVRFLDIISEF